MKKLTAAGNLYLKKMDLTDMALVKLCCTSLGVLVGLKCAKRHKKGAALLAGGVFAATWVPIMGKFVRALTETEEG